MFTAAKRAVLLGDAAWLNTFDTAYKTLPAMSSSTRARVAAMSHLDFTRWACLLFVTWLGLGKPLMEEPGYIEGKTGVSRIFIGTAMGRRASSLCAAAPGRKPSMNCALRTSSSKLLARLGPGWEKSGVRA